MAPVAAPSVGLPPPAWTTAAASRSTTYADWADTPIRAGASPRHASDPFERVTTRSSWTVAALVAAMAVAGVGIVAYANEMTLVVALDEGRRVSFEELETSDNLVAMASLLGVGAALFGAVTFLMWLHLAWVNVERRGFGGVRWSASWAVGWWFIPIMNLFRPYQVMSTLWRASQDPTDNPGSTQWAVSGTSALVGWWWALYLGSSVVGGMFSSVRAEETIDFQTWLGADLFLIVAFAMQIAAGVLAIQIVRRITAMQEHLRVGG
ncbi:MAG: DUF4328 domain-containing protein [Dehalococcoidia bacterium]|nr:DUF4328 domain-containing protein [Dehalococcoidia bacterium]